MLLFTLTFGGVVDPLGGMESTGANTDDISKSDEHARDLKREWYLIVVLEELGEIKIGPNGVPQKADGARLTELESVSSRYGLSYKPAISRHILEKLERNGGNNMRKIRWGSYFQVTAGRDASHLGQEIKAELQALDSVERVTLHYPSRLPSSQGVE